MKKKHKPKYKIGDIFQSIDSHEAPDCWKQTKNIVKTAQELFNLANNDLYNTIWVVVNVFTCYHHGAKSYYNYTNEYELITNNLLPEHSIYKSGMETSEYFLDKYFKKIS